MVTGFFKKLKNKLFNSSSKFTKNLDEAVNEVSKPEVDVNIEKKVSVEKSETVSYTHLTLPTIVSV